MQTTGFEALDATDTQVGLIRTNPDLQLYLHQISSHPLLSKEEEVELAQFMERGFACPDGEIQRRLDTHLESLESQDGLSDTEIAKEIQSREAVLRREPNKSEAQLAEESRGKFINSNLRLVVSIARKYENRGLDALDLIQEGNIGLMTAVKKFNWQRGYKFSTYATWWIRQAITRAVVDQGTTIRLPVYMNEGITTYLRFKEKTLATLHREPPTEEMAEYMGMSVERVRKIEDALRISKLVPLDLPLADGSALGDVITPLDEMEDGLSSTERTAFDNIRNAEADDILVDALNGREERILRMRLGLSPYFRPHTLEEVGQEFGVTRERIRQLEALALKKLRTSQNERRLREFL